eukprot:6457187-Prymnesium_polylepis.1
MVEAGLQVQREGDAVGKEVRERLGEENKRLAGLRKFAAHWRKRVLVGGPGRAEKSSCGGGTEREKERCRRSGKRRRPRVSSASRRKHMLARLRGEFVLSTAEARGKAGVAGGAQGWQMAAAWLRWRLCGYASGGEPGMSRRGGCWTGRWPAPPPNSSASEWVLHAAEQALMNTSVAEERTVA